MSRYSSHDIVCADKCGIYCNVFHNITYAFIGEGLKGIGVCKGESLFLYAQIRIVLRNFLSLRVDQSSGYTLKYGISAIYL
jgi:hypothetical protein